MLLDDIYFGEGPRWHDGRLWFSDFHAHQVRSVTMDGEARVELNIDDRPSGLGWMPDGSLLLVSMVKRQVLRRWPDGRMTTHADLSGIATFHCNDMVVDADGRAYVGNFGFDLDAGIREYGPEGVLGHVTPANLALIQPDGSVEIAADGLSFPNGMVITPDGGTLIVGETLGGVLTAFDIGAAGGLSNRRVWAPTLPRVPDGIALDAEGVVWIANPVAAECVRIGEGGAVLEVVETDQYCFACMLGGEDGRSLFTLTAPTSDAERAARAPRGKLWVQQVAVPRAGRP
jgi:sugar lactone lactonase YvrE